MCFFLLKARGPECGLETAHSDDRGPRRAVKGLQPNKNGSSHHPRLGEGKRGRGRILIEALTGHFDGYALNAPAIVLSGMHNRHCLCNFADRRL